MRKFGKPHIVFFAAIPILFIYSMIIITECGDPSTNNSVEINIPDSSEQYFNEFGLDVTGLNEYVRKVKSGQTLSDILFPFNIGFETIAEIARSAKDVFDVRKIKSGDAFFVYTASDTIETPKYFVYENDPVNYIVCELADSLNIWQGSREVKVIERRVSGTINNSLYATLKERNVSDLLALKLSEIFAWQIDFYRIQKGDSFKAIFEEKYIGDKFVGIGKVTAAVFNHWGEDFNAFYFDQNGDGEYFDSDGKSLRKTFLKAPLKFSRISSGYSSRRFHPVLKRYKSHLGTDYAAPYNTPILAVGDGIVIEAQYKKNNGNYVKIKHNSVYTTQYLHMNKFAKGIKTGTHVKQGQVIGYVGSTGLATGPHVCFRFWKNGQQVDHRREKFPASHPVADEYREPFEIMVAHLKILLDAIPADYTQSDHLASN